MKLTKYSGINYWIFELAWVNAVYSNTINFSLSNLDFFLYKTNYSLTFIFLINLRLLEVLNFYFCMNYQSIFFLNVINRSKNFFMKLQELELKGINYWFTKLVTNLLLDLGRSHFQLFGYPKNKFFISLKKKKLKKILFINFNKSYFANTINYFWYQLKSVGPYKLKGFQFISERIWLKEGKKPFK